MRRREGGREKREWKGGIRATKSWKLRIFHRSNTWKLLSYKILNITTLFYDQIPLLRIWHSLIRRLSPLIARFWLLWVQNFLPKSPFTTKLFLYCSQNPEVYMKDGACETSRKISNILMHLDSITFLYIFMVQYCTILISVGKKLPPKTPFTKKLSLYCYQI